MEYLTIVFIVIIVGIICYTCYECGAMRGSHKEKMNILSVLDRLRTERIVKVIIVDELQRGWKK